MPVAMDVSSQWLGKYVKVLLLRWTWLDFPRNVIQTVMPDLLGLLFGILLSRSPAAIREPGRWIFVVPAVALPILLVWSYFQDLHYLLFSVYGVRGAEYEGSGIVGLVFPILGIVLYSIGIRTGDRYTDPLANVFADEDVIPGDGKGVPKEIHMEQDTEQGADQNG